MCCVCEPLLVEASTSRQKLELISRARSSIKEFRENRLRRVRDKYRIVNKVNLSRLGMFQVLRVVLSTFTFYFAAP